MTFQGEIWTYGYLNQTPQNFLLQWETMKGGIWISCAKIFAKSL